MPSRSRCRPHPGVTTAALCFLLFGHQARGSDWVTVRAWADPDYIAQKSVQNAGEKETYVVAEGEYFDGAYRDPSISKGSLSAILRFLAPTLTKQGYYPAKDLKTADQLLVVHWGTTMGNMTDYIQAESNLPNPPEFHADGMNQGVMDSAAQSIQMAPDNTYAHYDEASTAAIANATAHAMTVTSEEGLLGYAKVLSRERQKIVSSEIQRTLEANMRDDRYFVILQAYDFKKLQKGEGRKLLWSVHMSVRAPGLNFSLALPRMGQVASDLYGQSDDDVVTGKSQPGQHSSVEIGPLTVLSNDSPTLPKK
jgi:hypothetical protein